MSAKTLKDAWTHVAVLAGDTARQQSRERLFFVVALFGVAMTMASLLFGAVSVDREVEVIRDVGLLTTELFGLAAAVLGSVTIVLGDIESRSLYVLLARPIPRWRYIVGRTVGLWAVVLGAVACMTLLHLGLLWAKGWVFDPMVVRVFAFTAMKLAVACALGVLLSVFSSSSAAALVATACLWILGHFAPEVRFMAERASPFAGELVRWFLLTVPDLALLNARDALDIPGAASSAGRAALHAAGYVAVCLGLTTALFSRKEF